MVKKSNILNYIYIIINAIFLVSAYFYEEPFGERTTTIISYSTLYFILLLISTIFNKKLKNKSFWVFIIMSFFIVTLEYNSKFAINYFYHTLYLIIIAYGVITFNNKLGAILSIIISLASFLKFIQLISIQPTRGNISTLVFFSVMQILIIVIILISKIYWEENKKTKGLFKELLEAYSQLKIYSKEIKELGMMEERTKIARDLHDTLGHDMTGLIMQMEIISSLIDSNNINGSKKVLDEAKLSARDSLARVRQIVDTLKNKKELTWAKESLKQLIDDFCKKTRCTVNFNVEGEKKVRPDIGIVLYRIIQEGLTNAVRHGNATIIYIYILYKEEELVISIEDNGEGCKELNPSNGIKGMKERIQILGGSVRFNYDKGFKIIGNIPYEREGLDD